jgi:TolA-binding protein
MFMKKGLVILIAIVIVAIAGYLITTKLIYPATPERIETQKQVLLKKGNNLFDAKKYTKAIQVYQTYRDKYPSSEQAEEAMMMVGLCYANMKQHEKAIEIYEQSIREYPPKKGWPAIYFYLGDEYAMTHQKDKAIAAFKQCIELCPEDRGPNSFPYKDASNEIKKLEGAK